MTEPVIDNQSIARLDWWQPNSDIAFATVNPDAAAGIVEHLQSQGYAPQVTGNPSEPSIMLSGTSAEKYMQHRNDLMADAVSEMNWKHVDNAGFATLDVEPAEAATIKNFLDIKGLSPQMRDGGSTLYVNSERLNHFTSEAGRSLSSRVSQLDWWHDERTGLAMVSVDPADADKVVSRLQRDGYDAKSTTRNGSATVVLSKDDARNFMAQRDVAPIVAEPANLAAKSIDIAQVDVKQPQTAVQRQPYQQQQAKPEALSGQAATQRQQMQEQQQRQSELNQASQSQQQRVEQQQANARVSSIADSPLHASAPSAKTTVAGNLALAPEVVPAPPVGRPFLVPNAPAAATPAVTTASAPPVIAIDTRQPLVMPAATLVIATPSAPVIAPPVAASPVAAPPVEILAAVTPAKAVVATAEIAGAVKVGEILSPERGVTPAQGAPRQFQTIEGNAPSVHDTPAAGHGVNGVMGAVGVATGVAGFADAHARGDHFGEGVSAIDTTVGLGNVATSGLRIAGKEAPAVLEGGLAKLGFVAMAADGLYQIHETKGPLVERDAAGKITGVGARGEKAEEVAVNTGLTTVASMATTEAMGGVIAANTAAAATAAEAGVAVGTFAAGGVAATVAIAAAPVVAAVAIGYAANKGIDNLKKEEVRSKAAFNEMAQGIRSNGVVSEFKHGAVDLSGKPNIADYGELRAFEIAQRTRDGDGAAARDKPGDYSTPQNMAKLQTALTKEITAQKSIAEAKSTSFLPSWAHSADESKVNAQMQVAHLEAAQQQLDKFKAETGDFNGKVAAQQQQAAEARDARKVEGPVHVAASAQNTVTVTAAASAPLETQSAHLDTLIELPAAQSNTLYAGAPEPQGYGRISSSYSQSVVGLVSTSSSTRGPGPANVNEAFTVAASGIPAAKPDIAPAMQPMVPATRQMAVFSI